uniref:Uncharacterized protein n=1 Tax=Trichobilharzia regenti TaxID=157069 RepID=A0AA85KKQ5_TRIRE|nr:unnamed protein product [Trichobilharzia regenti]
MQKSTSQFGGEILIRHDISNIFEENIRPKEFKTWVEVEKALKLFEKLTNTRYIVRESKLNKNEPHVKYDYVVFTCTFGHKRRSEGNHIRLKKSKYIGCASMVRFRYQSNKFIISSAYMVHNHLCNSECVTKNAKARKLNESKLYIVKPVVSVSSQPQELSAMDVSYQKPATHDNRCTPVTQNSDIENYQKLKRKFCKTLDRYVSTGHVKEATAFLLSTFNQLKELKMNR